MEFEDSPRVVLGDSSDSSSPDSRHLADSTYQRNYNSRRHVRWNFGRQRAKGSPVFDLAKLRSLQDPELEHLCVKPAITWNAKIFQSLGSHHRDETFNFHNLDLMYVDDRPIELPVSVRPTQPSVDTNNTVPKPVKWDGPVITIETFVDADIPKGKMGDCGPTLY